MKENIEMKDIKLCIGIPTINQYTSGRFKEYLSRYESDIFKDTRIFVIDNGNQKIIVNPFSNIFLIHCPNNLGVAGSWNKLCYLAITYDYTHILLLNDDILFDKSVLDIEKFILENKEYGFYCNTGTWCSFILSLETWKKVGTFDENFYPAYFEDNDYDYRMKRAGIKVLYTNFLKPAIYNNSMTIKANPDLNKNFNKNRLYYIHKWGGEPGKEKFN